MNILGFDKQSQPWIRAESRFIYIGRDDVNKCENGRRKGKDEERMGGGSLANGGF